MKKAVLIDIADNVVTVTEQVFSKETVAYGNDGQIVTALEDIPAYHKIAIVPISKEQAVVKYGEEIGLTTSKVDAGQHVDVHNLASRRA